MEVWKNIIISGSRSFSDYQLLKTILDDYIGDDGFRTEIITGGAKGADQLGEQYAREQDLAWKVFKPNWARFKRGAGIKRNEQMVEYASNPSRLGVFANVGVLFAFWDGKSPGTKQIIEAAQAKGLEIHIIKF